MEAVTHALLGAQLAHVATPTRARLSLRERLALGATAGAFPDVDFIGFLVDPLVFLADWHQGPTHSLLLLPAWAALLAGAFALLRRSLEGLGAAAWVCALGLASHIVADLLTAYGTMVLYPLRSWRPSFATTFLIDPWFTLILLLGLASSVRSGRRRAGALALAVLVGYVLAQAALKQRALDIGRASAAAAGLPVQALVALPQPLSPFNWKLIATGADGTVHHVAHLNVVGHPPLVPALPPTAVLHDLARAFVPAPALQWQTRGLRTPDPALQALVERLWTHERFAAFRRFATHPALSELRLRSDETCVWFTDLRYDLPALPDTFRYGFCGQDPAWTLYRLRYFSLDDRQRLPGP